MALEAVSDKQIKLNSTALAMAFISEHDFLPELLKSARGTWMILLTIGFNITRAFCPCSYQFTTRTYSIRAQRKTPFSFIQLNEHYWCDTFN